MASALKPEDITRLKDFIAACRLQPQILHLPELSFFKEYVIGLGGTIPGGDDKGTDEKEKSDIPPKPEPAPEDSPKKEPEPESEESDVELDNEGVIAAETEDLPEMLPYDENTVISEEAMDQSSEKRSQAMAALSDGDFSTAIEHFTEAIKLNPSSAALYAKRGQALLKQNRVKATIQDCDRAITINPDSAVAHKLRGRAYRLLGKWLESAKDLRLACKLDCDEQAMEWLAEVQPNATKLEEHQRKKQRSKDEKEMAARRERVAKAKQAQEEARKKADEEAKQRGGMPDFESMFGGGMPGGMGGMPGGRGGMPGGMGGGMPGGIGGMPDMSDLMSDPDLMQAFTDPEIAEAFKDVSSNPANIFKYKDNPKVSNVINKMMKKFGGMGGGMPGGMGGGMPGGMGGGMPGGMGGMPGGMGGGSPFTASSDPKPPQSENADDLD